MRCQKVNAINIENAKCINSLSKEIYEGLKDQKKSRASDISVRVAEMLKKNEETKTIGINIGVDFFEECISAYIPGHLWVVGGFTSSGKTAFIIELIRRLYQENDNPNVCVFSVEMGDDDYFLRLMSSYTGVPPLSIRRWYEHNEKAKEDLDGARLMIGGYNLILIDHLYTWPEIEMRARKEKLLTGLDIMIVDFVQNLRGEGKIYDRMSHLAPQMQKLTKDLGITTIALSQVSNEAATQESGILRYKGGGEIAAACDFGIMLQREKDKMGLWTDDVAVTVKKNRHGKIGHRPFKFTNNWTRITEV